MGDTQITKYVEIRDPCCFIERAIVSAPCCRYIWNSCDDPVSPYMPYRGRGRPRPRWDDHIANFCCLHIDEHAHWLDALIAFGGDARNLEQTFIVHVGTRVYIVSLFLLRISVMYFRVRFTDRGDSTGPCLALQTKRDITIR